MKFIRKLAAAVLAATLVLTPIAEPLTGTSGLTVVSEAASKLPAPELSVYPSSFSYNSLLLEWTKVEGAAGYYLYMYDADTGKYIKHSTQTGLSCKVEDLRPGTKYKFCVAAYIVNKKGVEKVQTKSKSLSVKTKETPQLKFSPELTYTDEDCDKLTKDTYYKTFLYSFLPRHSVGFASNGQRIDMEAEYGITAVCDGADITFSLYNHTDKKLTVKQATLQGCDKWHTKASDVTKKLTFTQDFTLDTQKYCLGGLYRILMKFSNDKTLNIFFYVNKNSVSTCAYWGVSNKYIKEYTQRRVNLNKAFDAAEKSGFKRDGSSELALDLFYYPVFNWDKATYGQEYRCDTQLWIDLSNSLVNKNWSKDHKAYVIYDWLIRNIAFDDYACGFANNQTRACNKNDYSGKYNVYNIRAGKCWDFANILTIMYRAQGIPTVQIGSDEIWHDWNAAYINGRWIELDASANTLYKVTGSDWTKREPQTTEGSLYSDFGSFPHGSFSSSDWVLNDELMYGDPNDKNSMTHYLQ